MKLTHSFCVPAMSHGEVEENEVCSICCEAMTVVAIGRCNHTHTCALCTLRLRLCYNDKTCPFCKLNLRRVFLTTKPRNTHGLFYAQLSRRRDQFSNFGRASLGVFVDNRVLINGKPLPEHLLDATRMSCSLCDEAFHSFKELKRHLRTRHEGALLCGICYSANRFFPRELTIFRTAIEFLDHLSTHPECSYCRQQYFGNDELNVHLSRKHWRCHLCPSRNQNHRYLNNAHHYVQHLQREHYVCEFPECRESLIAFATVNELQQHWRQTHLPPPHPPRPDPPRQRVHNWQNPGPYHIHDRPQGVQIRDHLRPRIPRVQVEPPRPRPRLYQERAPEMEVVQPQAQRPGDQPPTICEILAALSCLFFLFVISSAVYEAWV